jgi:hypothetical protein
MLVILKLLTTMIIGNMLLAAMLGLAGAKTLDLLPVNDEHTQINVMPL